MAESGPKADHCTGNRRGACSRSHPGDDRPATYWACGHFTRPPGDLQRNGRPRDRHRRGMSTRAETLATTRFDRDRLQNNGVCRGGRALLPGAWGYPSASLDPLLAGRRPAEWSKGFLCNLPGFSRPSGPRFIRDFRPEISHHLDSTQRLGHNAGETGSRRQDESCIEKSYSKEARRRFSFRCCPASRCTAISWSRRWTAEAAATSR